KARENPNVVQTAAVGANDAASEAPAEEKTEEPKKEKKAEPSREKKAKKPSSSRKPVSGNLKKEQSTKSAQASETKEDSKAESGSGTGMFSAPNYQLGAGMVTVDDEQWTRIALGVDVPIWKFGVFLDLELFMDGDNQLSNKGWDFGDDWADALARKIRYIRFGHEGDPLYVKFGGLSSVTLGYGIIVDHFTNMLHYPDEKLLGLQFCLNDITPVGLTVESMISDFAEAEKQGGIGALRVAVSPLKTTSIPLLNKLEVGATYALDRNVHAPAKKWEPTSEQAFIKALEDDTLLSPRMKMHIEDNLGIDADEQLRTLEEENAVKNKVKPFDLAGADIGMPIISLPLLNVDLYGQAARRLDDEKGWGMGAPGVAVELWKLYGNLEYRRISGRFTPGFFDQYYLDERLSRDELRSKAKMLDSVSLNGVFGRIGADLSGFFTIQGTYQYLLGEDDKDQRYEVVGSIGEQIINRVPKINNAQIYMRHNKIGTTPQYTEEGIPVPGTKAGMLHKTQYMYWGYKAGFEISSGATLMWDYRYGWTLENNKLVSDNHMSLETQLTF
ncbi:MAG: hypothetical protein ACLFQB_07965, partial [Chitinispirillaceae bacterium]